MRGVFIKDLPGKAVWHLSCIVEGNNQRILHDFRFYAGSERPFPPAAGQ
jgi:hypothetical protein